MNKNTLKKIQKEIDKGTKKININEKNQEIKQRKKDFTEKITNSDDDDEDDDKEKSAPYEFMEEATNLIKQYVEDDDKIREARSIIKKMSSKQKELSDKIIVHLERMGLNNINLGGNSKGKLIINKYVSKGTLNKELIEDTLQEHFKDPKITDAILNKIEDKKDQNCKTRIQLKRTFEKKG